MNETPPRNTLKLRAPQHMIHRKTILLWTLRAIILWGCVSVVLGTLAFLFPQFSEWIFLVFYPVIALALIGLIVEPQWRYRVHRWEAHDHSVYTLSGWLVKEWRVAPLSRVQTIDAVQGPIEQLLGLARLRVTTASSGGTVEIVGLDKETANELVERLSRVAELTPGDAT